MIAKAPATDAEARGVDPRGCSADPRTCYRASAQASTNGPRALTRTPGPSTEPLPSGTKRSSRGDLVPSTEQPTRQAFGVQRRPHDASAVHRYDRLALKRLIEPTGMTRTLGGSKLQCSRVNTIG